MVQPRQVSSTAGQPEAEDLPHAAIVYFCPTKDCQNYYAAPDFRPDRANLDAMQTERSEHGGVVETKTRRQCPDCYTSRGIRVDRVPYIVMQGVPLEAMVKAIEKRDGTGHWGGPRE